MFSRAKQDPTRQGNPAHPVHTSKYSQLENESDRIHRRTLPDAPSKTELCLCKHLTSKFSTTLAPFKIWPKDSGHACFKFPYVDIA